MCARSRAVNVELVGVSITYFFNKFFEVFGFTKVFVNRSEANIGHLIQLAKVFNDHFSNDFGGNFRLAQGFETTLDRVNDALDTVIRHLAFAKRDLQRARQLVAVER